MTKQLQSDSSYGLDKNDEEIISAMKELAVNPSWKMLCEIIKSEEVYPIENTLLGYGDDKKPDSIEEIRQMQDKLEYAQKIMSMPDIVVSELTETDNEDEESDEVYEVTKPKE